MNKHLIGLSGYARSGKDTVGQILQEDFGYQPVSFAAPLKEAIYTLNPLVNGYERIQDYVDQHGWDLAKTMEPEIRRLLQVMGTEVGREIIRDSLWIDLAFEKIRGQASVITDVRFPNEVEAIQNMSGVMIRIHRSSVKPVNSHASETAIDDVDFDFHIYNDGTIEDLREKVLTVMRLLHSDRHRDLTYEELTSGVPETTSETW